MVKPISVRLKKNDEGVGYMKDSFEPWWEKVYDQAAERAEGSGGREKKRNAEKDAMDVTPAKRKIGSVKRGKGRTKTGGAVSSKAKRRKDE